MRYSTPNRIRLPVAGSARYVKRDTAATREKQRSPIADGGASEHTERASSGTNGRSTPSQSGAALRSPAPGAMTRRSISIRCALLIPSLINSNGFGTEVTSLQGCCGSEPVQ